jgi:hypothetical protein
MEKVGMSNTGDSTKKTISFKCFRKHKLKDPKGKGDDEEGSVYNRQIAFLDWDFW